MDEIVTQKRCKKCGGTDFYKNGKCKACQKVYQKRYSTNHREKCNAYAREYYAKHREERCERNRKHYAEHPEVKHTYAVEFYAKHREEKRVQDKIYYAEHREEERSYDLMYKFGITTKEYDAMLVAQNGVCAICGCPPSGRRLDVDHDHETGQARGILCNKCNIALGLFSDNAKLLRKAADYLEKIKTTNISGDMTQ